MAKHDINRYIKSRWDARFLIRTIMGLLEQRQGPDADVVMAVTTAAVRSYSRGYSGKTNKTYEEGIYQALKDYAGERVVRKGKDAQMMECFIALMDWVESEVWAFGPGNQNIEKASASFPMDCFSEEQTEIVTHQAWERFHAKFYTSDGPPEKGLLVFEDKDGAEAFCEWMDQAHSDLLHQTLDDDSE